LRHLVLEKSDCFAHGATSFRTLFFANLPSFKQVLFADNLSTVLAIDMKSEA
jgi:hypothetical protein